VTEPLEGFVYRYQAGAAPDSPTLLLLHGTGGNEDDLLPLGPMLTPEAGLLSPRGQVLERGMPRFFRRLAEGVFDEEDLKARSAGLARFVVSAADRHGFDPRRVYAVGFSNGANIGASLLLLHPGVLAGAVLFRAMLPIVPDTRPTLSGTAVFMSNGRRDPIVPPESADRLAALLREAGADVTQVWQQAGHELTRADLSSAREWSSTQLGAHTRRA
jgi:phospholipase/carboxylesterase